MIILTIAGLCFSSSFASTSEGALVQTDISSQLATAKGNLTTLKTQIAHGIAAGPAYRGTFDIAWSCMLTILACIYNAIHLNVPRRNTGKRMLLLRKVKWATIALIAPEIVLYAAATQFVEAYKVKKEVNALRGQIRGNNKPKLIDLRYAFYLIMGGFAYDLDGICDGFSPVTLSSHGMIILAKQGLFIDIGPEDIEDKSKADILAKSLICIQVSWMIIQRIARKAAGYPLTLLEIHTMVHVVSALILYVLWWKASIDNTLSGQSLSGQGTLVANKDEKTIQILGEATSDGDSNHHEAHFKLDQEVNSPKPMVHTVHPGQYLPCGIGVQAGCIARYDLGPADARRWELAASAIVEILKSCPSEEYNLADTVKTESVRNFLDVHGFYDTFEEYFPNFRGAVINDVIDHLEDNRTVLRGTLALFLYLLRFFILLNSAYGGIHLTAWNFEFPSRIESIIWRIACFIIIGSSFAWLAIRRLVKLNQGVERYFEQNREQVPRWSTYWRVFKLPVSFIEIGINGSGGPLLLFYAASRLYLVVESFISLRHVPIGVYAAVPWVQSIPHV